MNKIKRKQFGILADFDNPAALLHAAKKIREAGYTKFDCHSPFPIHGMDQAMGLKRSAIGWITGLLAICGGSFALALQWWASSVEYPIIISGKPFFSYPAYVPVTFALAVLAAAFAATFGMLILNRLPQLFHPLFSSDRFCRFSDDGFLVSIEADDPLYDPEKTSAFLRAVGGHKVEALDQ